MKFDEYELRARLYPTLVSLTPLFMAGVCWFPSLTVHQASFSVVALGAGAFLLAQIARDRGRKVQRRLFQTAASWPTTQIMLVDDSEVDGKSKDRYLHRLAVLIPEKNLPDVTRVDKEPEIAARTLHTAVKWLREKTRNKEQFPVVFAENTSYGFRRNLWGLKPIGICLCLITVVTSYLLSIGAVGGELPISEVRVWFPSMIAVPLLGIWVLTVRSCWVEEAAWNYARALWSAVDQL